MTEGDQALPNPAPAPRRRHRALAFNVATVVVVGLLITAGLAIGAYTLHSSNEKRLLRQRAREVGVVASAAVPTIQTPLSAAAVIAESTNGNKLAFEQLMTPLVEAEQPLFVSVSLWPTGGKARRPVLVVGDAPELTTGTNADAPAILQRAAGKGTVVINNLLAAPERRLGYAYSLGTPGARYVVYAEAALPKDRKANIARDSAFADLGYALYLGPKADNRYLLASSTGTGELHGKTASVAVPFGDSKLLVVMSPSKQLGGTLLALLWWMLAAAGLALTIGAATLVGGLTRRREDAESLAVENARLYAEQRTVAQTLQHSLLAEEFPEIGGLEFGARYIAGVEGIDIGGDWYDVVRLERGNILMVVGDVSGRGLEAATMMAALRFSARAYAAEGHSPATILTKLSGLTSVARDGHFATVMCAQLDVATGHLVVANAGHPQPLLVSPGGAEFLSSAIGVPVGVDAGAPYTEDEFSFPRGSTLLLYTDGAIERRGERLDAGLQRLHDVSLGVDGSLEAFMDKIVSGVMADGSEDDTALLGVRWRM